MRPKRGHRGNGHGSICPGVASGAKSQRDEAQAQVAFAQAALRQAQAELTAEEAKYQQASQDRKRIEQMAQSNTVSPQQLDHAITAERIALAALTAARSKVDTQQSMLQRRRSILQGRRG